MNKQLKIVFLIFVLALGLRFYFAFQTPNLNHEGYYVARQVESISENGLPIFEDELSYGGRMSFFSPIYYYFLSFFNLFLPLMIVLKLIPNILACSIVVINYLIAKKITKNENAALFCSFISAFIPIFITNTLNNASVFSVVTPLTFLCLYFFIDIKKRSIFYLLISAFFLIILHPASFLLILGLLIYMLIMFVEEIKLKREETESIIFLTIFSIWVYFLMYKKAFLLFGPNIIWQNIPKEIFSFYFQAGIWEAIIKIGLIPIIFGVYVVYRYLFRKKSKNLYLLFGLAIACFFLIWFRLIEPDFVFMFLGTILVILFAKGYGSFFDYIQTTKAAKHKSKFIFLFIVVFILSSVIPSFYFSSQKIENAPLKEDVSALKWIKNNTKNDSVVAGSLKEGHMITAVAERKNIMDSNFFMGPNTENRFEDIKTIYQSYYKTVAIPLLNKYDVDYVFLSPTTKSQFDISEINYLGERCFDLVYQEGKTKVYESLCKLEEKS